MESRVEVTSEDGGNTTDDASILDDRGAGAVPSRQLAKGPSPPPMLLYIESWSMLSVGQHMYHATCTSSIEATRAVC